MTEESVAAMEPMATALRASFQARLAATQKEALEHEQAMKTSLEAAQAQCQKGKIELIGAQKKAQLMLNSANKAIGSLQISNTRCDTASEALAYSALQAHAGLEKAGAAGPLGDVTREVLKPKPGEQVEGVKEEPLTLVVTNGGAAWQS